MKKSHRATDQTLQEYLDSLLRPAKTSEPPVAEPVMAERVIAAAPTPEPRPFAEPVASRPVLPRLAPVELVQPAAPAPVAAPVVAPVAPPAVSVPETPAPVASTPAAVAPAPAVGNGGCTPWVGGRPHWAQERFECLLFAVGGLNLAVPLAELGTIYTLQPGDVAPLPGQADWFMGLLAHKQQHIRVIDSALVVMPERYQPAMRDGYRYVITLNGSDWGLAVDQVANALPLQPEQVRWRTERAKRAWLAGTAVEHMCALLDPEQLVAMFQRQDRRRAGGAGPR